MVRDMEKNFPEINEIKKEYIASMENYVNNPDGLMIHLLDFFKIKDADGFEKFIDILYRNAAWWNSESSGVGR